jgi:hypothetical protein
MLTGKDVFAALGSARWAAAMTQLRTCLGHVLRSDDVRLGKRRYCTLWRMRRQLAKLRQAAENAASPDRNDDVRLALGSLECRLQEVAAPRTLNDAEFKVFSQFGEDGAIQFLLRHVEVPSTAFVEIGVESYRESNTRFLALHDNWRGLALDGNRDHVDFIERGDLGWRADVTPVQGFVTADNLNTLLKTHGFDGELGLLSIDVDGMDYWLLEALEAARPAILVVEFNANFGDTHRVTVPYSPDFVCGEAHWSMQYFGASLAALEQLAAGKGYSLVGATKNAVNAFFVRNDLLGDLETTSAAQAWRPSRFLSSRDEAGALTRVRDHRERLRLIRDLPLLDLDSGQLRPIADIFGV